MRENRKAALGRQSESRPANQGSRPNITTAPLARQPLCKLCFYFRPVGSADPLLAGKGECWRYPPRACQTCLSPDEYPLADEGGFCGEFKDRRDVIASFAPEVRRLYPASTRG